MYQSCKKDVDLLQKDNIDTTTQLQTIQNKFHEHVDKVNAYKKDIEANIEEKSMVLEEINSLEAALAHGNKHEQECFDMLAYPTCTKIACNNQCSSYFLHKQIYDWKIWKKPKMVRKCRWVRQHPIAPPRNLHPKMTLRINQIFNFLFVFCRNCKSNDGHFTT